MGWFRFLWGGATGRTHEWSGPAEDQRRTLRGGGRVATTGLYFSQAPIINLLRSRHTARRTTAGCACARPGSSTGSAVGGPVDQRAYFRLCDTCVLCECVLARALRSWIANEIFLLTMSSHTSYIRLCRRLGPGHAAHAAWLSLTLSLPSHQSSSPLEDSSTLRRGGRPLRERSPPRATSLRFWPCAGSKSWDVSSTSLGPPSS